MNVLFGDSTWQAISRPSSEGRTAECTELTRDRTPDLVKKWLEDRPEWLRVQTPTQTSARVRQDLGEGEREVIELSLEMSADALLVDDRDARHEAQKHGVSR